MLHVLGSDLHDGNVLLRLFRGIDNLSPRQLYETYGDLDPEPVIRLDGQPIPEGVPTHGIIPVWLGDKSHLIPLYEAGILLTDFGESFLPSITPRFESNTPASVAAPEVYFLPHEPLSFPADIWALAVTIWSIISQRPLFDTWFTSADSMIEEHVDVFGKLSSEWWEKWEARQDCFNEDGVRHDEPRRPFAERLEGNTEWKVLERRRRLHCSTC